MTLSCKNLLTEFNAVPYQLSPLPEEMTSFGEDLSIVSEVPVELDYEITRDEWSGIPSDLDQATDSRLPSVFVDGALNSVEVAGCPSDNNGFARSVRAGQLGVGALSLENPTAATINSSFLLALSTVGFSKQHLRPLEEELQNSSRPFVLITWDGVSDSFFKTREEREIAIRDIVIVRNRLRRRVTDYMLEQERDLIRQIGASVYADGRYIDHQPTSVEQLVVGVIKSMRRRYLDMARMQVLYKLKVGERTPAFETESRKEKIISFYVRISPASGGATHGLVRIEISKLHFEDFQKKDWSLLNAIVAHITGLVTKDVSYQRAAVTLEPIKIIEQRIQRLFHPVENVAMGALNILR